MPTPYLRTEICLYTCKYLCTEICTDLDCTEVCPSVQGAILGGCCPAEGGEEAEEDGDSVLQLWGGPPLEGLPRGEGRGKPYGRERSWKERGGE